MHSFIEISLKEIMRWRYTYREGKEIREEQNILCLLFLCLFIFGLLAWRRYNQVASFMQSISIITLYTDTATSRHNKIEFVSFPKFVYTLLSPNYLRVSQRERNNEMSLQFLYSNLIQDRAKSHLQFGSIFFFTTHQTNST